MDIEPSDVQLVRQTFAMVNCVAITASQLLFNRLFELDPAARALFKNDLNSQRMKFMAALRFIVETLDKPEALRQMTAHLGQLHARHGVRTEQYARMEDALLWTLQRTLGRSFTPEVRTAWCKVIALVSEQMQDAHEHVL